MKRRQREPLLVVRTRALSGSSWGRCSTGGYRATTASLPGRTADSCRHAARAVCPRAQSLDSVARWPLHRVHCVAVADALALDSSETVLRPSVGDYASSTLLDCTSINRATIN